MSARKLAPVRVSDRFTLVLGILFLLAGAGLACRSVWQLTTYRRSVGSAVPYAYGSKGNTYYRITYLAEGQSHTIEEKVFTGLSAVFDDNYKPGEKLVILYPSAEPGEGMVYTFANVWLGPLICGGIGLLLLVCVALQASLLRGSDAGASGRPHPSEDPSLSAAELLALERARRQPNASKRLGP